MTLNTAFGARWILGFALLFGAMVIYIALAFRFGLKYDGDFLPFFIAVLVAPGVAIALVQYFVAARAKLSPFVVWCRVALSAIGAPLIAFVLLLAAVQWSIL